MPSNFNLTNIVLTFCVCVCVCGDSRSLVRHPKIEGWEVLGCTEESSPSCHPAIPPTPPLCLWARPDLGPRVSPTDGPLTKEPLGPPSRSPAHPIKSQ